MPIVALSYEDSEHAKRYFAAGMELVWINRCPPAALFEAVHTLTATAGQERSGTKHAGAGPIGDRCVAPVSLKPDHLGELLTGVAGSDIDVRISA